MFSSLRARLWLSYTLLIGVLLTGVVAALIWAFLRAPRLLYPEVVFNLRTVNETISSEVARGLAADRTAQQLIPQLRRQAVAKNVRIAIVDSSRRTLFDTGGPDLPYNRIFRTDQVRPLVDDQIRSVRLTGGRMWLYTLTRFEGGDLLLVLAPAPDIPLAVLVKDQFFSTILIIGLAALAAAFLLALVLGRWISAPLQRMVAASQAVARGEHASVAVEGPVEVRELADAMNEMSRQVQAGQQSMRDFVANVSHELKTPLTSIQGFSQAILDGAAATPAALQQAAGVIYSESARMHRLVLELLSLARLESGTADLACLPVDLESLLRGVVEKFTHQAQEGRVALQADLVPLPSIPGDGDRLTQVFTNLVDNAIKFTPPGGQVMVTARPADGGIWVNVTDTGPGIAPADQARIFERFYQVDQSRRAGSERGTGLGLAIARQIILAHGGKIWVESQPGQGSRFVVKIPLVNPSGPSIESNLRPRPKGKR